MKTKIEVKLKPFSIPNYVLVEGEEGQESRGFALSELDSETLESLCSEFRKQVFEKAGKRPPIKTAPI